MVAWCFNVCLMNLRFGLLILPRKSQLHVIVQMIHNYVYKTDITGANVSGRNFQFIKSKSNQISLFVGSKVHWAIETQLQSKKRKEEKPRETRNHTSRTHHELRKLQPQKKL